MRWLDGITDDGHEFAQSPGFGDGSGSLVAVVHGVAESELN